ncbi:LysR family transcriptional regulator [Roseomonas sp. CECT 9278]|uniref:LysR family transcriptional regulator n=1 Tax=Roseomonas sp. CECT 9278 TaxID=2845823 RepID=UPI001E594582|nr:LysR family transcriptional regulator [Roseomonas sp. CECT 9278]CAH0287318.1 HTH-type transcriptional regulator GbpR [Roseomonas sp. CECT 9278]
MDASTASRLARRLRLKDLDALLTVIDAGSMARAAQRLALTQPAVSKAMSEMEATLGVPLLERDARGVRPTAFGEALADRARAMLDELGQAERDLAHIADPMAGEVRIGTTEPMTFTVAEAIRRLAAERPRVAFDIAIADTGTLVAALRARRLDVVVTRAGAGEAAAEDIAADWLYRVPLVVVADRGNPLLRRRGLRLADVTHEPWTLSPPGTFLDRLVVAAFAREGLDVPRAQVVTVSIAMRLALIAGGPWLSILPRNMLHHPTSTGFLRALDITVEDPAGAIAALTLRRRYMPGPVRAFLDVLRESAPHMPGVDAMS